MSNTDKHGNLRKECIASNEDGLIVPGESKDRRGELKLLVKGERQSTGFETGRALSCVEKIKQTWRAV
jgi:hypothetical protein